ncbi:MAG: TusE/DsrC/DsvC family sulfur relay protein [Gammaproteobacteria bacterium]|nr:TusE/DsrC/DsvC family sulfur relay protein [Gammaproteobacteria bacterium]
MQVQADGRTVELSEAGWLNNLDEWTEEVANKIAAEVENIPELTQEHWDIIVTAREYFAEYGTVAEPRLFSKLMKKKYGDDRSSQKYIYSLFPTGLIKCANKIAGLPRPKGCS